MNEPFERTTIFCPSCQREHVFVIGRLRYSCGECKVDFSPIDARSAKSGCSIITEDPRGKVVEKKTDLSYVESALDELLEELHKEIEFLENHNFKIETVFKREQYQLIDRIRRKVNMVDNYEQFHIEELSFTEKV
jgi:hypothetical protein